jgi:CheY-like chemotaxis protein
MVSQKQDKSQEPRMKLLIIDDSAVDRQSLSSVLAAFGHTVDEAAGPTQALTMVEQGHYDLVFLDVVMPEQDGYKFLRTLRLNPKTSNQYVVFCSSKKTPLEINYGIKRAGANDYLPKPATPESVQEVLERIPA